MKTLNYFKAIVILVPVLVGLFAGYYEKKQHDELKKECYESCLCTHEPSAISKDLLSFNQ